MKLKVKLDEGAYMPERAHDTDAGLDIRTPVRVRAWPHDIAFVDTGVHVEIPKGCAGFLMSKSGLCKDGITTTGLIDEGYTGPIGVTMINHTGAYQIFNPGDKVTQLVIVKVEKPTPVQVDKIDGGERGDNGFGSTGR